MVGIPPHVGVFCIVDLSLVNVKLGRRFVEDEKLLFLGLNIHMYILQTAISPLLLHLWTYGIVQVESSLLFEDLLPSIDISTVGTLLFPHHALENTIAELRFLCDDFIIVQLVFDEIGDLGLDYLGLMRPNLLFQCGLVAIGGEVAARVLVGSLREGNAAMFGV